MVIIVVIIIKCFVLKHDCFHSLHRYLFELSRKSDEVPDPNKEAIIDQWVEWESVSLQVSHSVGGLAGHLF